MRRNRTFCSSSRYKYQQVWFVQSIGVYVYSPSAPSIAETVSSMRFSVHDYQVFRRQRCYLPREVVTRGLPRAPDLGAYCSQPRQCRSPGIDVVLWEERREERDRLVGKADTLVMPRHIASTCAETVTVPSLSLLLDSTSR